MEGSRVGIARQIKRRIRKVFFAALPNNLVLQKDRAGSKRVYLTFDDGPNPEVTPRILDILKMNDVRATFYLIGQRVEKEMDLVRRMHDDGHELGNHSYSHVNFQTLSFEEQKQQIEKGDEILAAIDGRESHSFRPPWGKFSIGMLRIMSSRAQPIGYWSYDSMDYLREGPDSIVGRFESNPLVGGEILLFHDDYEESVSAIEKLIPRWKDAGFEMCTMCDLHEKD